jgi:hypothetical protein
MRKGIEIGSVSLKKALTRWTMRKSLTYLTIYHGLQPTLLSLTSCIDGNPASSIAADLRELWSSFQTSSISSVSGISTPASLQTSPPSASTRTTPVTSGSMAQRESPTQTTTDGETSFSSPQAWSPVSSCHVPQSQLPISQEPSPSMRAISVPRPRKHVNSIQKKQRALEDRTCEVCGKSFPSVGNKNRHVVDMHTYSNSLAGGGALTQEPSPGTSSPLGMLQRKSYVCQFGCGSRYTQARNRNDHEKKCWKREAA